ncbi:MAG TPA: serine hydrolase [Cyclobacteriaceae bacterium]|nr:serine hydrolase [Cyclobacteriaceae bacterium]
MKLIKKIPVVIVILALLYGINYAWRALPIISGYGSKMLCSCVMLAGRQPDDVIKNELGRFPLTLGSFSANFTDSSATGSVFGLAVKKAVYRKGLGCSLINEISEDEFRHQHFTIAVPPPVNTDTIPWPLGDKLSDSLPTHIDFEKLDAVIQDAFHEPGPEKLRRTRSIVVVYNGQIVAEKYAGGFDRKSRQIGWSMTKSITNALVGILVRQGKLEINERAPIDAWKNDDRNKITVNHLLHASSGLAWVENYGAPSDATNMLFKKKDMGLFAAGHRAVYEPETRFQYSSGTTNILSWIIRQKVGNSMYHRFPSQELFYKIGVYSAVMEPDAGGTFVGSSYSFATARDWARFGLFYLNDGVSNGERILPEEWVKYTVTPAPAAPKGEYGAQFWLNAGAPGNNINRYYPDAPTDLYLAEGYEGQNVFIIPSKKLVIVKLSLSQGDYLDDNKFLADIVKAFP